MTGWAAELGGDAVPTPLVEAAVRLAVAGTAGPERLAAVVRALLDRGVEPRAEAVLRAAGGLDVPNLLRPDETAELAGRRLAAVGARVVVVGHRGYPPRLADAWPELGAPVWLFARAPAGGLPPGPAVAVVGTRHPTLDGLRTAEALARLLASRGVTVVSGMARGIDQAAHRGALRAGGRTVAVLGAGFDVDYPRGDRALREEVAASGGLCTELPPHARPRPVHFLQRNRIIAGLADVTVVVEGQARSGSLQTARLAASQGRDVWAVPGSVNAPTSRGPLDLIRDGAEVVTRIEDVLEAVGAAASRRDGGPAAPALDEPAATVWALLGAVPATVGALAGAAGLAVPDVLAAVAELTARGLARATPRGVVRDLT